MKLITVIGIDLSLTGTGIVVLDNGVMVHQQLIKTKPVGDKPVEELKRIASIRNEIEKIVIEYKPSIAVIENLAFGVRNATALTQLSGLNYFTREMLFNHGIQFVLVSPTSLKKFAMEKGIGEKEIMMMMLYKDYGVQIMDNNIVDAYFLALVGTAVLGKPVKKATVRQKEVIELIKKQINE